MGISQMRLAARCALVCVCLLLVCVIASPVIIPQAEAEGSQVLMPTPSGNKKMTYKKAGVTIDYGNVSQGYVMIKHKPTDVGLKVRITMGNTEYTYDLNGRDEFEVFPLQLGNGKYNIQVFSRVKGNYYALVTEKKISVKLVDPNIIYLYPSQYVNYTADSKVVAKSNELCEGLKTDREKVMAIYAYCSRSIHFDYIFATKPKAGYLPDIDLVLANRKGICFDYAALMAGMLRAQGIPTKLVIGYADKSYHAWNNVLIDGKWYRFDATFASVSMTAQTYREERYY
ncbi:MAG: transglutaminase-like domain-containing protein [Clostridia bacterium]|nr:transglutaminase-like domain-containing protein [Clostridia bacterium]